MAFLELLASAGKTLKQLGVSYQVVLFLTGRSADREKAELEAMLKHSDVRCLQVEAGRLSVKALTDNLPPASMGPGAKVEGYLCGPPGFESAARDVWTAAGFPSAAMRSESFAY